MITLSTLVPSSGQNMSILGCVPMKYPATGTVLVTGLAFRQICYNLLTAI